MTEIEAQSKWSFDTRYLRLVALVAAITFVAHGVVGVLAAGFVAAQANGAVQITVLFSGVWSILFHTVVGLLIHAGGRCLAAVVETNWYQLQAIKSSEDPPSADL
ncbi:MAG: hypothetical protein AAF710_01215 [Planctomycetota bacterium]